MSAAAATTAAAPEVDREKLLARPLQHNKHWSDVKPLKQDDGEEQGAPPVVPINYPAHYSDVMDIFRAVLASQELSPRTLLLSEAVIDVNSANYSAWHFRRQCLEHLRSPLSAELEWVAGVARDTPKNYQLWHHRRCLLERLDDRSPVRALSELALTAEVLEADSKNYHAWSHRQWCLHFFSRPSVREAQDEAGKGEAGTGVGSGEEHPHADVFAAELVFIEQLLRDDVRNNSAWNQRFFVRTHAHSRDSAAASVPASADSAAQPLPMSPQVLHAELAYTGAKLLLAPHNESPWNYLEGLTRQKHFGLEHRKELIAIIAAMPADAGADGSNADSEPLPLDAPEAAVLARAIALPNRFAQSLLVELWQSPQLASPRPDLAAAACGVLARELDPIRERYWLCRQQQALESASKAAQK